ncbi:hypothetical protein [Streptomyces youssoufiensis]
MSRPLPDNRTGGIAAGLLPPPDEVLRLDGHLLPKPLHEDAPTLALAQAGQLPVDLRRDLRAPGAVEVDHGAAVPALAARVQPDLVVASLVRARATLHQARRISHPYGPVTMASPPVSASPRHCGTVAGRRPRQ